MVVCNINTCPLRTCRDVKENFAVNFDGEQELLFGNSIITVYCEGMQRTNPKEFITLKADREENYSEIYDKRLRKWNVCPNAGNRQNTCKNCIDYTASGITYFKKIRLDIRRMVIVRKFDHFIFLQIWILFCKMMLSNVVLKTWYKKMQIYWILYVMELSPWINCYSHGRVLHKASIFFSCIFVTLRITGFHKILNDY